MPAVVENQSEAQATGGRVTNRELLSEFLLKLGGRARFWTTAHQEQVVCPIYGLGKSDQGFVEFLRELRGTSTDRNESNVPRFDKVATLLDVKESQLCQT